MAKRLFIALPLAAPAVAELSALIHVCRKQVSAVRWVRPEHLHVTLRFLGDVEASREEALRESLAAVTAAPFSFNLAGVGAFPDRRRPRVIWTGVDSGRPQVSELAARVEAAVLAAGFAGEARPFAPHVTIGRTREAADWDRLWKAVDGAPFVGSRIDARELKLVESRLTPAGPVYTTAASFPLRGGPYPAKL